LSVGDGKMLVGMTVFAYSDLKNMINYLKL
jgi:hypothetical protein